MWKDSSRVSNVENVRNRHLKDAQNAKEYGTAHEIVR
jgi:hypothetical protein